MLRYFCINIEKEKMQAIKFVLCSLFVLILAISVHRLSRTPLKQTPPEWRNFGRLLNLTAEHEADLPLEQFRITVTKEEENYFSNRLAASRLPPALDSQVNMTYGFPSHALPELRDTMSGIDLRKWASKLNTYKHYKAKVFGLDIHFVRVNGAEDLPRVPLLFIHGWPGSFYEFYSAIPLLLKKSAERGFTYDIIVPSLPGFGYSEAPYKPGCSPRYAAAILNELMTSRLGYKRYVVQGGDWGSFVTEWIVGYFPENVIGFHLNMFTQPADLPAADFRVILYQIATRLFPSLYMSEEEIEISDHKGMFSSVKSLLLEGGYFHLQATKPDTVGVGVTDSPLGLAAYIIEKFYVGTDDSLIYKPIKEATEKLPFSIEQILYDVIIYWHSNSIMSSMRFYKEGILEMDTLPFEATDVPSGVLISKYDGIFSPKVLIELKYTNLQHHTVSLTGGHFAAFGMPEVFSQDIVEFTAKLDYQRVDKV